MSTKNANGERLSIGFMSQKSSKHMSKIAKPLNLYHLNLEIVWWLKNHGILTFASWNWLIMQFCQYWKEKLRFRTLLSIETFLFWNSNFSYIGPPLQVFFFSGANMQIQFPSHLFGVYLTWIWDLALSPCRLKLRSLELGLNQVIWKSKIGFKIWVRKI